MRATLTRTPRPPLDQSAAERSSASGRGAPMGMPHFLRVPAVRDQNADAGDSIAIEFPHASSIQSATGAPIPGSAIYDPDACNRRGVPAFTDGHVSHFATPTPALHIAAHEATHQLQHSGYTNDAGMGAEWHAHAVANSIESGASPRPILGERGHSVAPALRDYAEIPAAAQTSMGQWMIGSDARVANTGLMVTSVTDRLICYAEPSLIDAANQILEAKMSGVRLRAGAPGPSGDAPDASGVKSTVEVIPQVRSMTSSGEVWADCGRMSREIQGVAGTDTDPRGFYRDTAGTERETTPGGPTDIRDAALVGAGLGTDAASARAAYHAMAADPTARDAFDRAHGINRYAAPDVGESYMSVRNDALTPAGFNFHWGGVVMVSGGDRVTFENFARPGTTYNTQNALWYFDMYGPPSLVGQTWHDRWAEGPGREGTGVGEPGMESMTIPTRTSPNPLALTTGELITRRGSATSDGERMVIDAELSKRWIKVTVNVVSSQESTDEVYAHAEHDGRSRQTGEIDMSAGDRNTFWIPLSALMPVTDVIIVRVYDSDVISDDVISRVDLRDAPVSDDRPWDDAEYHTTVEFDR